MKKKVRKNKNVERYEFEVLESISDEFEFERDAYWNIRIGKIKTLLFIMTGFLSFTALYLMKDALFVMNTEAIGMFLAVLTGMICFGLLFFPTRNFYRRRRF